MSSGTRITLSIINHYLRHAEGFELTSSTPDSYEIYWHAARSKIPRKRRTARSTRSTHLLCHSTEAPATSTTAADTMEAADTMATAAPPQSPQSVQAASPSSMDASGPPPQQPSLLGPTPMTPYTGFTSSMGQEAFGFGSCAAPATQTIHEEHLPDPGQMINGN